MSGGARRRAAARCSGGRREDAGGESGFVLPTAVVMLFVIATLAGAAATAAITGNSQSDLDRSTKRAVAAADAGLNVGTYRVNKLDPGAQQCVVVDANGDLQLAALDPDGWCPAQTEDLGDGASYSYRTSAGQQVTVNGQVLMQRKVVSTGLVNGVQRRAIATVGSATGGTPLFAGNAVISLEDLELENNARVVGNVASNGNITVENNAEICGDAAPGPGKQLITKNNGHQCAGFSATPAPEPIVLNPVDQGDAPTVNDNARIGVQDPWTSSPQSVWDPATRVLRLRNNSTLTLTGNVYSFCFLEVRNNAQLIIGARDPSVPLKIYMDAPENCPGVTDAGSAEWENNGALVNVNSDPTTLQLYAVGSSTIETEIEFENNFSSTVNVVIYAPRSEVEFENNVQIVGAVAAKEVEIENNASIAWHEQAGTVTGGGTLLTLYQRQSWAECTATSSGPAPDSGC